MSLELLKQNVLRENQLTRDLIVINNSENSEYALPLLEQIKILNNALPDLVNNIPFYKFLGNQKINVSSELLSVSYQDPLTKKNMNFAIRKKEHNSFLEHLSAHNSLLLGKKAASNVLSPDPSENKIPQLGGYIRASNKMFKKLSDSMIEKGSFDSLKLDLRKITSPFIINSYVSMLFFSTFLAFIFGIFLGVGLFFAGLGILGLVLTPLIVPLITFLLFYKYPSSQRKTLEKQINQELPFVTIYMSAIATSGIEPSKIFDILVTSKDYPSIQREIKKLTNYINFYGYDITSALKMSSKGCPSERLAQLFEGISTTISSGGALQEFLNKHSETLLFDYRLEREKYTHVAETFMNIYISVVIAAPMIMMMLFILMSLTGFATGFLSPTNIGFLTILVISMLNIGFIVFLNMKQPKF